MYRIDENIEISSQIKLTGDEYAGFYSNGLTMQDSETMRRMSVIEENDTHTVMRDDRGVELEVLHEQLADSTYMIRSVITNKGENDVTLEMADSFSAKGIKADKIHRMTSFWSAEGRLKTDDVKELGLECSWNHMAYRVEKFGNVGSMPVRRYFPFVALEDSDSKRFIAFLLYTPSSWQVEIVCRHDDLLTVNGGIADRDFGAFSKKMVPGAVLETPRALMAIGSSMEEVCDKLVKAQKPDVSPIDDHMGITFNEYCATWGNPNEENMKKVCDHVAGKGIQYLVMDSGWYGKDDGYWWDYTGEWEINTNRFPNGLKPVADYIRSKGMIPGIWFEFENVTPKCKLWEKAEWLLKKDGVPLSVGGRRFLDMENPEVKEHLRNKVIKLLKDNGYGYIKVDYNDTIGIGCDGPDGLGENLRRKVLATQEFFKELRREIPELVIENCSSGGHRLEPSMMELASMASFSDAHEIPALPIIAANVHRIIRPEQNQIWAVFRAADSDARLYCSICSTLFGRMGLSGDIYDMSEHQWDIIHAGMDFYKKASEIIRDGYTQVLECNVKSYNDPEGGQLVVRSSGDRTLVVYHRFGNSVSVEEFAEGLANESVAAREAEEANEKASAVVISNEKILCDKNEIVEKLLAKISAGCDGDVVRQNDVVTYGKADRDFSAQAWIVVR
ncbi:MAG: alpha-galactosidase [Lachnospiraceae bacterium]|nr:alpha-galactosidase [Lachnospiraceae bacterium]